MRAIAILAISALLAGCDYPSDPVPAKSDTVAHAPIDAGRGWQSELRTVHDDKHGVTCWYMTGGYNGSSPALSCLPDSQIKETP